MEKNHLVEYFLVFGLKDELKFKRNSSFVRRNSDLLDRGINAPETYKDPLNPFAHVRFEAQMIDQFPPEQHSDSQLSSAHLEQFCLPTGFFLTQDQKMPLFYTFVWSDGTGERLYGSCLRFFEHVDPDMLEELVQTDEAVERNVVCDHPGEIDFYAPKCICLMSYYPFIGAYRALLQELYRISTSVGHVPIERQLLNFMYEVPLPPKGLVSVVHQIGRETVSLTRPAPNDPLSEQPIATRLLFELVSLKNILSLYISLCVEKHVIILSSQLSPLTELCESLLSLLYPFNWHYPYIPLAPKDLASHIMESTIPIFAGTHIQFLKFNQEELEQLQKRQEDNLVMYYVDEDKFLLLPELPKLPKKERRKLKNFLRPISQRLFGTRKQQWKTFDMAFQLYPPSDVIKEEEERMLLTFPEREVRGAFCRVWFSILRDYKSYIYQIDGDPDVHFHRARFLKSFSKRSSDGRSFLEPFLNSQAFSTYLEKCAEGLRDNDVKFFDEKIAEKLGRSRFVKAKATPFLNDTSHAVTQEYNPPAPRIDDLENQMFSYKRWPKLNKELFYQPSLKAVGTRGPKEDPISNSEEHLCQSPQETEHLVYGLWFKIFIANLDKNSDSTMLDVLFHVLKRMTDSGVTPRRQIFTMVVECMGICGWIDRREELVAVMNYCGVKPDQAFYHALVVAISKICDNDIPQAYKLVNFLPHFRPYSARNRAPFIYRPVEELQKNFEKFFPDLRIETAEECPHCRNFASDLHIRLGWTKGSSDYTTRCPHCDRPFAPRFHIKNLNDNFESNVEPEFTYTYSTQDLPIRLRTGRRGVGAFVKKVYDVATSEQNQQPLLRAGYEIIGINGKDVSSELFSKILDIFAETDPPIQITFRTCAWCSYLSPCVLDKEVNSIASSNINKGFSSAIVWNLIWQFSNYDLPIQMFTDHLENVLHFEPKDLGKFLRGDDAILKILGYTGPIGHDSSSSSSSNNFMHRESYARTLQENWVLSGREKPVALPPKEGRKRKKKKKKKKLSGSIHSTPKEKSTSKPIEKLLDDVPPSKVSTDVTKDDKVEKKENNLSMPDASNSWMTNIRDVSSTDMPLRFVPDERALNNENVSIATNAFVVDMKQLYPDLNVVTFQHLLKQYILSSTVEIAMPFLILMADELNISNKKMNKKFLRQIEKFRRRHWKRIRTEMELQHDELIEEANREFIKGRAVFDDSWDYQRAVIYFLEHNCDVKHLKSILKMTQQEVIAKLETYSNQDLDRANRKREEILAEWSRPMLSDNFKGWNPKKINVIICGKSGCGKSSLINIMGKYFGMNFQSEVDVVECTLFATKFDVHSNLVLWDAPGHSTKSVNEGKDGSAYIREYCLTHFDFVVIVMAARSTKFATDLFKQLRALEKEVCVVRTKIDQDIVNARSFDPDKSAEMVCNQIKENMKGDIGASDSEIFLCADISTYFETAKLCHSILTQSIKTEFPQITEKNFNRIKSLHDSGMSTLLLTKQFNLTDVEITHIFEYHTLQDTLWKSQKDFVEESRKNEQEKESESDDCDDIFDNPVLAAIFADDEEDDDSGESEKEKNEDIMKHINTSPLDALLDIDEEDQVLNNIRSIVEETLPAFNPFSDDAMETLEDLRCDIMGKFCFSKRLKEIETVFSDKENEILTYMERKEKIKAQVEKEFAETLNVKGFSDIEKMLENALVENRTKIEEETKRVLLQEHNERLQKEEEDLKWLLHESDVTSKQAFIFAIQFACDPLKMERVAALKDSCLNEKLRHLLAVKRKCLKTRTVAADHFCIHVDEMNLGKLMHYFKQKMPYFRKMWKFPLPDNFQDWKEQKRIAVIGSAGMGKSTFVRTLLSQVGDVKYNPYKGKNVRDIPIKIDVVEATLEPHIYPLQANIILMDFPGSGTVRVEQGVKGADYIRKYHILHHHVIIIVTCSRFHETEIEIARICMQYDVKFLFVRTKFDHDLQNTARTYGAIGDITSYAQGVCTKLKTKFHQCLVLDEIEQVQNLERVQKVRLFFINGKRCDLFHFPQLIKTIEQFLKNAEDLVDLNFGEMELNYSSDEVFFSIVGAKGWAYKQFVKELHSWRATIRDLVKFNRKDFELLGIGRSHNAIRKGVLRLIHAHKNKSKHQGNSITTAIRSSIESVVKGSISKSEIVDVILDYIYYYEDIRVLTPHEVSSKLSECHEIFAKYAVSLQIDGDTLLHSSNEDILSLMNAKELDKIPTLKKILHTKLNDIRMYEEPVDVEEIEQITRASLLTTDYLDDNKVAAVLVVTKDRKELTALKEAADLEKAFARAGYSILCYGDRVNARKHPITATSSNFYEVAKYIHGKRDELDGCFIFILTHGYTKKNEDEEPQPMVCTEDGELNVFQYLREFEDYEFPCIFGINACRVPEDSSKSKEFDIPYWTEFGPQLFVSWGASKGREAREGKFVQFWRHELCDVTFNEESISSIAGRVKTECARWGGGVYHDGLESVCECKRGIFITDRDIQNRNSTLDLRDFPGTRDQTKV